ncbi:hypothetical protein BANRA_00024 [Acinetobacter baumannii]|nr:hypothetical protein BANRA_00024 [Acinetobacter baumannii]
MQTPHSKSSLRKQMISFKGLGPKRFKLYKDGKFDFDKFFDPEGRFYSLDDLRKLDEKAFKKLGL